jgi:hypothetical protein
MALELSVEAEAFLQQTNIQGNIILEIDGFPNLYGSVKVTRLVRIGDFVIGDGTKIGGSITDETSKDYISLTGTTNNITQKLDQDKGGSSSITSFKIRLIDSAGELTRDFSPGIVVDDILGREAVVYWQAVGSKHPQDSARLFVGVCSSASFGAGHIDLTIQHPETLKRQQLLPKVTGELTAALSDVATAALATNSTSVVAPLENLETYIRINDEVIKIVGITSSGFLNMERAQFGTIAASHEEGDEYETLYRLQGDPIELSLRLMLSGGTNDWFTEETATRFEQIDAATDVRGAIFFNETNVQDRLGLVVGDQVAVISGADAANLVSFREIVSFGTNASGSYVVIDYDFTPEIDLTAVVRFKSKYDKLNFGAGLKPYQVDVEQFESLDETFNAQFFTYDYYVKDTLDLKPFIDESLFYPSSLFSLPRAGRISLGISAPPILGPNAKTLDASNITNATRTAMTRSINNAFFNSVAYKFNEDILEDKLLGAEITTSEDSFNRVRVGIRTLEIEAGGIRDTPANRTKIQAISNRFLDRYQFGAETIQVETDFKTAFGVEPGDTVILDGASISLADITQGNRNFLTRIMEVTNKSINLKTGKASLELADTNLSTRARYGVFAPSSIIGAGSTTSEIVITRSFGTSALELEKDKWTSYIAQRVRVRNDEYTFDETVTLTGVSESNPNILEVNPPLSTAPSTGFIIESPVYDDSSKQAMSFWKSLHCYFCPQVLIISGTTTTVTVGAGDISKFYIGAPVQIHLADYSENDRTTVAEISGNTLTLNKTLDFSVTSSHLIDLIGFSGDEGSPYAWY